MKSKIKWEWWLVALATIVLTYVVFTTWGCTKTYIQDPNDPNNFIPYYGVDPNVLAPINTGVGLTEIGGPVILTIGTTLFPQYAGIFSLVGLVAGYGISLWRKLNPILAKAYTKNEIQAKVIKAIVGAVEAASTTTNVPIKADVSKNLEASEVYSEGKALITEAKIELGI